MEKFRENKPWESLTVGDLAALADPVAKLPADLELDPEHEDDQQTIPVIAAQLALIQDIQDDEWWVHVSYPMLEVVRRKLRLLVPLIERSKKGVIYSDFLDEAGDSTEIGLPGTGGTSGDSDEFAQVRKKAQHFLKEHLAEAAVAKVRSGEPLTADDLAELQRILVAGIGNDDTFAAASAKAGSFGRFVRSLIGLDRVAAKAAFAEFLDEKRYSKNQITFVNLIIFEVHRCRAAVVVRGVAGAVRRPGRSGGAHRPHLGGHGVRVLGRISRTSSAIRSCPALWSSRLVSPLARPGPCRGACSGTERHQP